MRFEMKLNAPFSLANTNPYFGGWASSGMDQQAIAMTFPVEGWQTSAAVIIRQNNDWISGEVSPENDNAELAWKQALAVLSLDVDPQGWPEVGQHDPVIGHLQTKYQFLRPVLFHSPYEAAASFIIGHRMTMQQGRAIRQAMAQEVGDKVRIDNGQLFAFPRPQILRELSAFKGINSEKIHRLRGIADAALDGRLDRARLLSMPIEQALAELRSLNGIGEFFSQGILFRGAGIVDELTNDDVTKQAIQLAYKLPNLPNQPTVQRIAEAWRPYRMWAEVLLHVWLRREQGGPRRQPHRRIRSKSSAPGIANRA